MTAALKAARRVNDFPTAVRIFEGCPPCPSAPMGDTPIQRLTWMTTGIKAKVESQDQYKQYLEHMDSLRQELGVALREELYPGEQ